MSGARLNMMKLEATAGSAQRYRAKAARRPVLFWWQAFLLLACILFLWSRLPVVAVLFEARVVPPLPEPHAAYVTLDPANAARVFKKAMMAWTTGEKGGKRSPGMDLAPADLEHSLQSPEYLEQGAVFPGVWRPAAVAPLTQRLPELPVPGAADVWPAARPPSHPPALRTVLDLELTRAGFAFPAPKNGFSAKSGSCRYYLETDADGTVAHLLLFSPRTDAGAVVEQALSRGTARGAARGFVDIQWSASKP